MDIYTAINRNRMNDFGHFGFRYESSKPIQIFSDVSICIRNSIDFIFGKIHKYLIFASSWRNSLFYPADVNSFRIYNNHIHGYGAMCTLMSSHFHEYLLYLKQKCWILVQFEQKKTDRTTKTKIPDLWKKILSLQ